MNILKRIRQGSLAHPDRLAVVSEKETLTWGELDLLSARLAAHIEQFCGDNKSPIAVYGHKKPMMLVCFLACVRSGRAYCPIDISVPDSRTQLILDQMDSSLVLATEPLACSCGDKALWDLEKLTVLLSQDLPLLPENMAVSGDDTYYIIFTSGSTGTPKGVQITANCLNHYLDWSITLGTSPDQKQGQVFLNQAPFSFDLSVMDLYTCLACGGTLFCLSKSSQADYRMLLERLEASKAQVWVSTPSFADICLTDVSFSENLLPELELFLFCGETLTNKTVQKLQSRFPKAQIMNTYGPTESTVAVTQVLVDEELNRTTSPLPVGCPKPGTLIEIWKEDGTVASPGEKGEIIILGDTVSSGYYKRPDLTEKAFFTCQRHGQTIRGYHTGDEGYLEDNMLYYGGRIDLQIKLHGYRIELGDIENNILRLPGISQTAVIPRISAGKVKSLAAFTVCQTPVENSFAKSQELKKLLKDYLPDYMIPKKFIFLEELPVTANGKADRKALSSMLQPAGTSLAHGVDREASGGKE